MTTTASLFLLRLLAARTGPTSGVLKVTKINKTACFRERISPHLQAKIKGTTQPGWTGKVTLASGLGPEVKSSFSV
jgi:hypothetical protein